MFVTNSFTGWGSLFLVGHEFAVGQLDVRSLVDVLVLLGIEECGIGDGDVLQTVVAGQAMGADGSLCTAAGDVADMDVAPFRHAFGVLRYHNLALVLLHAVFLVGVGTFKDDCLVLDVGHYDVTHVDAFSLSATADAALEAQSGVGTREAVVAHYDVLHSV